MVLEGDASAGGIDRDSRQELAELLRRTGVEGAVGTLGEAGDLAEHAGRLLAAAFVENEDRNAEQAQLAGAPEEPAPELAPTNT